MHWILAPMLVVALAGVGLEPCAFWGSCWCILGQTHATLHVAVTGEQAKFCIYLKALLAGSHSNFFLVKKTMEEPSGGNILRVMIGPAVVSVSVVVVGLQLALQEAVV